MPSSTESPSSPPSRSRRALARLLVAVGALLLSPAAPRHVYRKVPGWSWVLWYPMFFRGGFAIHGYPSVPAYPASHGCVRVPMWAAPKLYAGFGLGTTVRIHL